MALPLVFDFYNSIIEVPAPDTSLDIQYLINQIRDTEDELTPGLQNSQIAEASGKYDLGGGVYTAITVRLLDNWRIRFEARPGPDTVQCTISGGNLVGGPAGNPIAPSAYTQVLNLSSASGVIATPSTASDTTNLKYMLASMSPYQKTVGTIYYWDPVSGNDSYNGLTPTTAVATFAQAHTLVTAGKHDVIFALTSDPSGITTTTETLNITKASVKLRGPGYTFQLKPSSTSTNTITVAADNVEISGFYVSTAATGSQNAISVTADNILIKDSWITDVRGHGISCTSAKLGVISVCVIENCGASGTGQCINLGQDTTQTVISKCILTESVNGIVLSGTGIADNVIEDNLIYNHSGYGVSIGTGVNRTTLRGGNTLTKNTSGNTQDLGTDTYIESPAGGASATEIADSVWDEVISGHTTADTAGRMLKDAKTKATLASLK